MSDLIESLDKLTAALESYNPISHPALEVVDQYDKAKEFLSEKAQKALSKKSISLSLKDKTGFNECIFLGRTVKTKNISEGIEAISKDLNLLADNELIHSCLTPPSSMVLARMPLQQNTSAVFSFVLVPSNRKTEAESLVSNSIINDGMLPEPLGSLEHDLDEGEFLAKIDISHFYHSSVDPKESLNNEIQAYLNILPQGTEVVEIINCAVISLSTPYEIRFRNPLMADYKQVKLNYRREAVKVGEDKIEQFNLLTDVEYTKKNGK